MAFARLTIWVNANLTVKLIRKRKPSGAEPEQHFFSARPDQFTADALQVNRAWNIALRQELACQERLQRRRPADKDDGDGQGKRRGYQDAPLKPSMVGNATEVKRCRFSFRLVCHGGNEFGR